MTTIKSYHMGVRYADVMGGTLQQLKEVLQQYPDTLITWRKPLQGKKYILQIQCWMYNSRLQAFYKTPARRLTNQDMRNQLHGY